MTGPLLSRVVTCYHQWHFVEQWITLDGLFRADTEWIIVNDSPTDTPSDELLRRIEARNIRIVSLKTNIGRSNARNAGANTATGLWVDFVDGDDLPLVFDPAFLLSCSADLVSHPTRITVIGKGRFMDGASAPLNYPNDWAELLHRFAPVGVAPSASLWQRSFFLGLGGFDGRFDGAEDTQLVFRAMQAGGQIGRSDIPKQCYFSKEIKHTYEPQHIYGHRRLFEYILRETDDVASKKSAHFWLGKECVFEFLLGWRLVWKNRSAIWQYTKSRLRIFG